MVVRDAPGGLEAFLVLRHARSGFLGGAVVFPGGKVEPSDESPAWDAAATAPRSTGARLADAGGASARALAVAACRETFEEAAIVPVDGPLEDADVAALAREVDPAGGLAAALAARGLRLALDALVPWARWVTPTAETRRFDARFFLLPLPAGQVGRHDDRETTSSFWARPADVIARATRGEIFMAPPTLHTLELLAGVTDVAGAVALAGAQSLLPICPRFVPAEGDAPPFLALPGDVAHAIPARRAAGPTRYEIAGAGFVGRTVEATGRARTGEPAESGSIPEE